jgi:hypothetical protein
MPDEMIVNPVQNSGGARAAAVFLSAHVLQLFIVCTRAVIRLCLPR